MLTMKTESFFSAEVTASKSEQRMIRVMKTLFYLYINDDNVCLSQSVCIIHILYVFMY